MSKQIWCGTLITGTLLVLAAGVILLHAGITRGSDPSQRVRVQLALTHLELCGSCHTETTASLVVVAADHPVVFETAAPVSPAENDPVRAQLIDLGHRLLDLPVTGSDYYETASDVFLSAYQAYRAGDGSNLLAAAVQQVIEAEHHANPVQVRASIPRESPDTRHVLTGPPPVTWAVSGMIVIQPGLNYVPVREELLVIRPEGGIGDMQRRGPPAPYWNSVQGQKRLSLV